MFIPPSSFTGCRAIAELIAPLGASDRSCSGTASKRGYLTSSCGSRGSVATCATMYFEGTAIRSRSRRGRGRRGGSGGSSDSDSDEDIWSSLPSFGGHDGSNGGAGGGGGWSGGHAGYNGLGDEFFRLQLYEHAWIWQALCLASLIRAAHHAITTALAKTATDSSAVKGLGST